MNNLKTTVDGILTGCASTLLFNPIDKALYLSVRYKEPIYTPSFWKQPYQGAAKALYGRVIGYGVYFSFYDIYLNFFKSRTSQSVLAASLATGATTVTLTHGLQVLKYYQWSHKGQSKLLSSIQHMVNMYGWSIFFRGFYPTIARDCLFSTLYFSLSDRYNREKNFSSNVLIACFSSAVVSPINFYRSRQFFKFQERTVTLMQTICELAKETAEVGGVSKKIKYVVHGRFNIGLGTVRVGLGMACVDWIYHFLQRTSYPPFKRDEH